MKTVARSRRVTGADLQVGQEVRFAEPMSADEATERFVVVELRGPRVLVEFICDMAIKPQQVYLAADLVQASDRLPSVEPAPTGSTS
jgi:hypothetical protein